MATSHRRQNNKSPKKYLVYQIYYEIYGSREGYLTFWNLSCYSYSMIIYHISVWKKVIYYGLVTCVKGVYITCLERWHSLSLYYRLFI